MRKNLIKVFILQLLLPCLIFAGTLERRSVRAGWDLISVPGAAEEEDLCAIVGAGGTAVFDLRDRAYRSCADGPVMLEPGRAYWVFISKPVEIDFPLAESSRPARVMVKRGWNLIGSPTGKIVPWDDNILVNGKALSSSSCLLSRPFEYDPASGGYRAVSVLEPWRGYAILAAADCSITFPGEGGGAVDIVYADLLPDAVTTLSDGTRAVAGQAVVRKAAGADEGAFLKRISEAGGAVRGVNEFLGIYQVEFAGDAQAAMEGLKNAAEVAGAAPNIVFSADDFTPDDPPFAAGAPGELSWPFVKIGAPGVWSAAPPAGAPVIAIVDTGVDGAHPDLAGRVMPGAGFVVSGDAADTDPHGHGTHIAGIAAAAGDNGTGIAGVCWNCRVMPVKVCSAAGDCPFFSVLNGITYAANNGANVINISLTANAAAGSPAREIFQDALNYAAGKGAVVVAAAGNGGADAAGVIPASLENVFSVAATDADDARAPFSNFGGAVDIAAPGLRIYSLEPGGGAGYRDGTSAAAGFVSGAAGLALTLQPTLTAREVEELLASTAAPVASAEPMGAGRLDLAAMREKMFPSNRAPEILEFTLSATAAAPGGTVRASFRAIDPDGGAVSYSWSVSGGSLSAPNSTATDWTLPAARGVYRVAVRVSDGFGGNASAERKVVVGEADIVYMRVRPAVISLKQGESVQLKAVGDLITGETAPINPEWTADVPVGVISPDGKFTATAEGEATLTATLGGIEARARVFIDRDVSYPSMVLAGFADSGQNIGGAIDDEAVVIGDLDNDGDNDIVIGEQDNAKRVYLNTGGVFNLAQTIAVSVTTTYLDLGDIDNDGDLDLVESADGEGWRVYRNKYIDHTTGLVTGNKEFDVLTMQTLQNGTLAYSARLADADNDGDLDLFGANRLNGAQSYLFLNDGTGAFTTTRLIGSTSPTQRIQPADVDRDGDIDFVEANFPLQPDKVFLNDGTGIFADSGQTLGGNASTAHAELADIDADGDVDMLTCDLTNSRINIFKNNGAGTFAASGNFNAGKQNYFIAIGDHDNDGDSDVVTAVVGVGANQQVYNNNGAGVFSDSGGSYTPGVDYVRFGDTDGDGDLDIVNGNTTGGNDIFINDKNVSTAPTVPAGLLTTVIGDDITFTWNASTDAETASNLITYDLRVGTSSGGNQIFSGAVEAGPGSLGHPDIGGTLKHTLKGLPNGVYYWSARAADAQQRRSAWAAEQISAVMAPAATCTVTNSNDSGAGSLRNCITWANTIAGYDTIDFGVDVSINLASALPAITERVIIDGNGRSVDINGGSGNFNGFTINRGGTSVTPTIIRSIEGIRGFYGGVGKPAGIYINTTGAGEYIQVTDCRIGTNTAGTAADKNFHGIKVAGNGANNIDIGPGNLISGNNTSIAGEGGIGVFVENSNNNVWIEGNYIGTDAAGTAALGNVIGIRITGSSAVAIGTNADGTNDSAERNIISGNGNPGIEITGNSTVAVKGNYIGTDNTGANAISNTTGIAVNGNASNVLIGTNGDGSNDAAESNVISGSYNTGTGTPGSNIQIESSSNVTVAGNYIGTKANGNEKIIMGGTSANGVEIKKSSIVTIGGDVAAERNIIMSHSNGIQIFTDSVDTATLTVRNNFIGISKDETILLGNNYGIFIQTSPFKFKNSTIRDNVIARSTDAAIYLNPLSTVEGVTFRGNKIGVKSNGIDAAPNDKYGLHVFLSTFTGNTFGGAGEGNIISNSGLVGVYVQTSTFTGNTFGGSGAGEGNSISNNGWAGFPPGAGIHFQSSTVTGNNFYQNTISNSAAEGIYVENNNTFTDNYIGGVAAGRANTIYGNANEGIKLDGSGGTILRNLISGNKIYENGGAAVLGIELVGAAHNAIARPSITSHSGAPGNFTVNGTTCASCRVELFRADNPAGTGTGLDTAGGEAFEYLGFATATAGGAFTITGVNAVANTWVTAITFKPTADGTSEFSANYQLTAAVGPCDLWQVSIADDSGDGSLRTCITEANSTAGAQTITFDASLIGQTITLASALPTISDATGGTTINNSTGGEIVVSGNDADFNCFTITSANNTIRGLTIIKCSGTGKSGILITGASATGNTVAGNIIGTDSTGQSWIGNDNGVYITSGAKTNTIGGTTVADRNIISSNYQYGVAIDSAGTEGNKVIGNYIGTDATGNNALENFSIGIVIGSGAKNNIVGGTTAGERNVICGNNGGAGVAIYSVGTTGNKVIGNYIGTDSAGMAALSSGTGVIIGSSATNNTIGGDSTAGEGNVISGNTFEGVTITGNGTDGNTVSGNYIGTDVSGTVALGNALRGISIENEASNNTIGGTTAGKRNIISGNAGTGISIYIIGTDGNNIIGNYIGVDASGAAALGNGSAGVEIDWGASGSIIGGRNAGEGNIIAHNADDGVYVGDPMSDYNTISGNSIFENGRIGIDLAPLGHGIGLDANEDIFPPLISSIVKNGSNYDVSGSIGCGVFHPYPCTVELFRVDDSVAGVTADPLDRGQGFEYLGYTTVAAGAAFSFTNIPVSSNGTKLTATLTDATGNTSEFAINKLLPTTNCPGWTVTTNAASGAGSLRECINEANSTAGAQTITFTISGATISPTAALPLPTLTDATGGTTIDARTKNIEIDGASADIDGFVITSNNNSILGLAIYNFDLMNHYGVKIDGGDNNTLKDNRIGTDFAYSAAKGNRVNVILTNGASNNIIGGAAADEGNYLASSEGGPALSINGTAFGSSDSNTVYGNYIGTNAVGANLGNKGGVSIMDADNNIIGGTVAGQGNVIAYSAAGNNGVSIFSNLSSANDNKVIGNQIYGNAVDGVWVSAAATIRNKVSQNSIYGNTAGLGINLDTGANAGIAAPTMSSVARNGANFNITVTVAACPAAPCNVELYCADNPPAVTADGSGAGEGWKYLQSDNSSPYTFTNVDLDTLCANRKWLTATVTDNNSNTSEFAVNIDGTPPSSVAPVNDGVGADIDTTLSTTQLEANWTASTDAESGIAKYWYAIGTTATAGASDTVSWTNNGAATSFTKAGLTLAVGQMYYVSVKAENGVGMPSDIAISDGQMVMDLTPPTDIATVNDGVGADIDTTTSLTQLSANWTASSDPESGVAKYWYAIGTSAGATNTVNWTDNGAATSVTKAGLTLTMGQTYYVTVKAQNGAGLLSGTTASDGQMVIDATPPTNIATVNDGVGADIDTTPSDTQLSANWTASSDAESGIAKYWYSIGTVSGASDTVSWTDNALSLSVTKSGLTLTDGQMYYVTVKAQNGYGLMSVAKSSDGQTVDVPDTTPPTNIATVNDGVGADIDTTTSLTQLSANWTASSDTESGVTKYWYAIGTSAGATNTVNWTDNGAATGVTKAGLTLTMGQTYYFSVKAENGVGLQSVPTNSDGQKVIDATPPTNIGTVNDGTGADIDTTTSLTQLSANWTASSDPESGVAKYWYSIGTSAGASDTVSWTDNALSLSVTKAGLALTAGQTYYVTVKAQNGYGLMSNILTSDGQEVNPPPVVSNVIFSPNPAAVGGSATAFATVTDGNGAGPTPGGDIASVTINLTTVGGGALTPMTCNSGCGTTSAVYRVVFTVTHAGPFPASENLTVTATDSASQWDADPGTLQIVNVVPKPPTLNSVTNNGGALDPQWLSPSKYTDNSTITDPLTGHNIYRRLSSGSYNPAPDFTDAASTATNTVYVYSDSTAAAFETYCYSVTAVSFAGVESAKSNEICETPIPQPYVFKKECGNVDPGHYYPPDTPGIFNRLSDITADGNGFIYVADTDNNRVQKLDEDCNFIRMWGKLGSANAEFIYPRSVAYANGEVFVVDDNNRVQVFSDSGVFKRKWPIQSPIGIEYHPGSGNLYISTEDDWIYVYQTSGTFVAKWSVIGLKFLDLDPAGNLYYSYPVVNKIKILDPSGAPAGEWGGKGTAYGKFNFPYGVATDAAGQVYVAEATNKRIQIFDSTGALRNVIPGAAPEYNPMQFPAGLDVSDFSGKNKVFLCDRGSSRIMIFEEP